MGTLTPQHDRQCMLCSAYFSVTLQTETLSTDTSAILQQIIILINFGKSVFQSVLDATWVWLFETNDVVSTREVKISNVLYTKTTFLSIHTRGAYADYCKSTYHYFQQHKLRQMTLFD